MFQNLSNENTPQHSKLKRGTRKGQPVDLKYRLKGKIILANYLSEESSSIESEAENFAELSYNEVYGLLDSSKNSSNSVSLSQNSASFSPFPESIPLEFPVCSTPNREERLGLNLFENVIEQVDDEDNFLEEENFYPELELFEGSDYSTTDFSRAFDFFAGKHTLTSVTKKDLLSLFANVLPSTNNVFSPSEVESLPAVTVFKDGSSDFFAIDLMAQLKLIVSRNLSYLRKSWSSSCDWSTGTTVIEQNQLLLNMNIDGVALFKSRKLSVWPIWVEVFNLPPKLRSKFDNHLLLGLWKGIEKPNWETLLKKTALEMELFLDKNMFFEGLGYCSVEFLYLICDMPAMALLCCVQQFNGYYGCPYCYIKGIHQNHRMLYPVSQGFVKRKNSEYNENANSKNYGVKALSPLSKFFGIPWEVPIDPMHQIFLGAAKTLAQVIISKVTKNSKADFESNLLKSMVPYENLHKAKSMKEVKYWKAADFRLFFFHIGPLLVRQNYIKDMKLLELFNRLSLAIRFLSEHFVTEYLLSYAEKQIKLFCLLFLRVFGLESQSFNLHTIRHLIDQVKKNWASVAGFGFPV